MLRSRVVSAVVLIGLIAGPAVAGGLPFLALIALVGAVAAWELVTLLRQGGHRPILALCILLTVLFIVQAHWQRVLPVQLVLTLAVTGSLVGALGHKQPNPVTGWAFSLAGALYLGWLLGHFVRLRALENGLNWLLVGAVVIWAADTAAYFVGRAIGRRPLWPRHSPKKTWEGYLAGVAAGGLAAGLLGSWLLRLHPAEAVTLGLISALVAPLGDLAESMIKRQVGAKDSSQLIPGHGGVLDRIDSLLFAIPLVFYWATLLPRWPA